MLHGFTQLDLKFPISKAKRKLYDSYTIINETDAPIVVTTEAKNGKGEKVVIQQTPIAPQEYRWFLCPSSVNGKPMATNIRCNRRKGVRVWGHGVKAV